MTISNPSLRSLSFAVFATLVFQACADDGPGAKGAAGSAGLGQSGASGSAGMAQPAGASGSAGDERASAGAGGIDGEGASAGADEPSAGAAGEPSAAGAAGAVDWAPRPADVIESGRARVTQTPRPAYGALLVTNDGARSYVVESRGDVEAGPYGLPWRSRFRLAAYDDGALAWAYAADPDDVIGDVVVHPSGEITLSLERHPPQKTPMICCGSLATANCSAQLRSAPR